MTLRLVLTGICVVLALSGCAAEPAETLPTATPTPTPTETPEPTTAVVLVGSETLDLLGDTGQQLGSIDYAIDTADAIAQLTEVFGTEPQVVPYTAQHMEETNGVSYVWPGFEVRDYDYPAVVTPPYTWQFQVLVTAAEVGEISVQTVDELSVGSSFDAVMAAGADPYPYNDSIPTHSFHRVDLVDVPPPAEESQDPAHRMVSLQLAPAGSEGIVLQILAPYADYQY
jgi:hypothetical protein